MSALRSTGSELQKRFSTAGMLSILALLPLLVACRLPKRDNFELPEAAEAVNRLDAEGNVDTQATEAADIPTTTSEAIAPTELKAPTMPATPAEPVTPRASPMDSTFPDTDSLVPVELDLPPPAQAGPPSEPAEASGNAAAAVPVEQQKNDTLSVAVSGVEPNRGPVRIAVFTSAAQFPDHQSAVTKSVLPSSAATIQGEIDGVSAGPVALAVYQDLNNDGELNRSSFGIPVEPYGFSNDARGQMGPPSFTDAQVQAGPNSPVIPISLTKLKF
ncbi:MAG: DUF2141 domain-containing protein [bacterium]|nr:DUF2141 domain-containing protein [bacterium]